MQQNLKRRENSVDLRSTQSAIDSHSEVHSEARGLKVKVTYFCSSQGQNLMYSANAPRIANWHFTSNSDYARLRLQIFRKFNVSGHFPDIFYIFIFFSKSLKAITYIIFNRIR